ncbi:hypothetical protein [Desulfobacter curvatus]|uniref:hypothetical protein n=1 Tax=Desulfobacter curvatus TaxID=2290 RepID=UPI0003654AD6|nr:hypothetical protein [Desulfobacter curvatus]
MKSKIFFVSLFFWMFTAVCFAEFGERFEVDGYDLHISATQLSKKLIVRGDVKYGEPCSLLKIYVYVSDDKGHSTIAKGIIKNYRRSGRFTIKKNYSNGGNWTITDISVFKK